MTSENNNWFGFNTMLDGVIGDKKSDNDNSVAEDESGAQLKPLKSRKIGGSFFGTPKHNSKTDISNQNVEVKEERQSYLQVHEVKSWHKDLKSRSSQVLAKTSIIEAISAIRATLNPIKRIGPYFGTHFKWSSGSRAPDGRIFFAPHGAEHVLCLNPSEGTIAPFGDVVNPSIKRIKIDAVSSILGSDRRFSDAVVDPKGEFLYLIPGAARQVIKVDISLGTWIPLEVDLGGGDWKWGSAVLVGDRIFASPHNSNSILRIDCSSDEVTLIGDDIGSQNAKYGAPVIVPFDKACKTANSLLPLDEIVILFPPLNARRLLVLNPSTNETVVVGEDMGRGHFKYDGACVGADGAVYCVPSCAGQVMRIEVDSEAQGSLVEEDEKSSEEVDSDDSGEGGSGTESKPRGRSTSPAWRPGRSKKKSAKKDAQEKPLVDFRKASFSASEVLGLNIPGLEDSIPPPKPKKNSKKPLFSSRSASTPRPTARTKKIGHAKPSTSTKTPRSISPMGVPPSVGASSSQSTPFQKQSKYVWPPSVSCCLIGAERSGNFKFGSAVLSADGRTVIGIPMNGSTFISIDSSPNLSLKQRQVLRMGNKLPHNTLRYGGGVVGLDGFLYCPPLHSGHVLRVDTLALSPPKQHVHPSIPLSLTQDLAPSSPSAAAEVGGKSPSKNMGKQLSVIEKESSEMSNPEVAPATESLIYSPMVSWQKTSDTLFSLYNYRQDSTNLTEGKSEEDEAVTLSTSKALIAIKCGVHWRKWAAARARESRGVSASDRVVGNNDKFMKSLLLHEPEVWCYGLTLENSSIPEDLSDWLNVFAATDEGGDFIDTCGLDATEDTVLRVASVPSIVFSLISLEKHALIMRLPIVRRAIVKPISFCGDWLVRCLADRRLMEGAVEFFEVVSRDLNISSKSNQFGEVPRNKTFEQIASIDHLVSPMLRLPHRLQDRIASTELMAGILDELFTERPLAMLIIWFDFFIIVILLSLLIRATWQVQHEGPLKLDEIFVIMAIIFFNLVFLTREFINMRALRRLGLTIGFTKTLDVLTTSCLFAIVVMSFFERLRLKPSFLIVASVTSGLCWMKLLGFLSGIHLQFAVYLEALKLITKALRIYIVMFIIILAMFANMYYVVMKESGYNGEDDVQDLYEATFTHAQTAFLTLFRMLLGDFEIEWYRREGEQMLTAFALVLFIVYMIFVFIIMMNVLIAVVCDNYSFAMSKAHEIFLRSRLQTVANLDMQGFTKLRNVKKHSRGSVLRIQQKQRDMAMATECKSRILSSSNSSMNFGDHDETTNILHQVKLGESFADMLDHFLKDSMWHRYMRKYLGIQRQTRIFKKTIGKMTTAKQNDPTTLAHSSTFQSDLKKIQKQHEMKTNEIIRSFEDQIQAMQADRLSSEDRIVNALEKKFSVQIEGLKAALLNK